MDKELIDYIITHYSVLLSFKEKAAQKHLFATEKVENFSAKELKNKVIPPHQMLCLKKHKRRKV